jgi:hypothetical protein
MEGTMQDKPALVPPATRGGIEGSNHVARADTSIPTENIARIYNSPLLGNTRYNRSRQWIS